MMRFLALMMLLAAPAHAQIAPTESSPRPTPTPQAWSMTVGAATVLSPVWQGSSDMAVSILPNLRVAYRDDLFASVPEGIGWNAVKTKKWRAGPLVKARFGRDENNGGSPFLIAGRSNALVGMGNVQVAGEVGGFVERRLGGKQQWRFRGEVRQGFGGHQGIVADASVNYRTQLGHTTASFGPAITVAGSNFVQTYFGIDASQSLRTGLARYTAKGGILSYSVGGTLIRPLDRRSAVTVFSNFDRLGGPAADSPLVRQRGQRTQFTLGLAYGFRFNL